jgi:hypothetical protein
MDLLKEAFIEGYKQRAESSDLIFGNASRMYAISLFDKWKSEQLILSGVSTRTFAENQEVTYKGKKYFFKEYNPKNGKTLIANAKSVRYNDYNDWWVDSTYVC